jgi:hypothetical protein
MGRFVGVEVAKDLSDRELTLMLLLIPVEQAVAEAAVSWLWHRDDPATKAR